MKLGTAFGCDCSHSIELLQGDDRYPDGTVIWRHGKNMEAAMVVTPEMRDEWAEQGISAVGDVMWPWVERIHEYEVLR